jgi:hypothetical protein
VSTAAVVRGEWEAAGRPVTALGPRGHLYAHPLVREVRDQERHAAELGAVLGLDPSARRRLGRNLRGGRVMGGAVAADRTTPARRRLRGNVVAMPSTTA